ncbi:hypothetical protein PV646_10900 [Streptomyces sp. ID05-26A]|uniref:hypothetical protein n=1 Tax=Lentzea pudingi TaxID=1789439 RepID=UPI00166CDC82|nr:hypothetical protein [Lentzea pudingi]MDX3657809.1 hypothetical protein [Streptomyces sp. ID05-26A]
MSTERNDLIVDSSSSGSTSIVETGDTESTWRGMTGQRRTWQISCGDVVERDRQLTVKVVQGQVVLVGPPGETAVLSHDQLVQLRAALREAADQAER